MWTEWTLALGMTTALAIRLPGVPPISTQTVLPTAPTSISGMKIGLLPQLVKQQVLATLEKRERNLLMRGYLRSLQDVVGDRDKPARNLAIARTQFERTPTAKAALDLARSIAYAGGDLTEAIGARHPPGLDQAIATLRQALDEGEAEPGSPRR